MTKSYIEYPNELPEIEGRDKYSKPTAYLQKKKNIDEYEVIHQRRPSKMLLVNKLRAEVDTWREENYPGASETSRRLFQYWFDEDHIINNELFRFYFCQQEAIETLVYIVEILKNKDIIPLIKKYAQIQQSSLIEDNELIFQTTMDGKRQLRRYFDDYPHMYSFKQDTGEMLINAREDRYSARVIQIGNIIPKKSLFDLAEIMKLSAKRLVELIKESKKPEIKRIVI